MLYPGSGSIENYTPQIDKRLLDLWQGRIREGIYNNKPVITATGWMTRRPSYTTLSIFGSGDLYCSPPAIVHTKEYLLRYYYDITISSGYVYSAGDVLYNDIDNIASTILSSTESSIPGVFRIYTARDMGSNFVATRAKIVSLASVQRVIDYKLQADSKNFYYFSDNNEWVVYHTFDEEPYYGNRFYPTLGAVSCYDENDSEIHPTDILFYPECISNGIFEGAKTIIKWASNQSGKVCFNPGYSNDEARDQSRLILPVSRHGWNGLQCNVTIPTDFRSTAVNIIEPFMTVDALDNGNIVEHAFVYHFAPNLADPRLSQILHYGNIKIRADKRFFTALDEKLENKSVNTDILNVITLGANNQWDLVDMVSDIYKFIDIQGSNHATSGGTRLTLDADSIAPSTPGYENFDIEMYNNTYQYRPMLIDNIGWIYDPDSPYKYQLKFYVSSSNSYVLVNTTSNMFTGGSTNLYNKIISIDKYEALRPLVKVDGVDGYLKIVRKSRSNPIAQVADGKFEAEYVLEFPSAPGSTYIRGKEGASDVRMENQFVFHSDFIPRQKTTQDTLGDKFYYRNCQIFFPQSFVKAGGFTQEFNERLPYNIDQSFTSTVFAESGFQTYAYRRNVGGYEQSADKTIIGKAPIKYPTNVVYRSVIPNRIESKIDGYEIEILANDYKDMKLFVLYKNDKWKYDTSKYESISGRENPAYIFEIDSTALVGDYSANFKTMPTLPDVKRWFTAYCRGFAYMNNSLYTDRVLPSESSSELVMDIWDNNGAIGTKFIGVASVSNYSGAVKITWISGDKFLERRFLEGTPIQVMNSTGAYQSFTITSIVDDENIIAQGSVVGQIQNGQYKYLNTVYEGGNWRSITPSANDSVVKTDDQYINDYKLFKFGGQTIVDSFTKIKKYFDLKSTFGPFQATEFTEIQETGIISPTERLPLTMYGFNSGYGSNGTQCKFNSGSYLLNDTISGLDGYSMCFVINSGFSSTDVAGVEFTIPSTEVAGDIRLVIGVTYSARRFTIQSTIFWTAGQTTQIEQVLNYGQLTDSTYVMIVKNGSSYSISACMGYNDPIYLTTNLPLDRINPSELKVNNVLLFGTTVDWYMNKFYMFNRALSTSEFLSFMRDGTGQDLTGADRYIDDDGKMYFRARVSRARTFNIRKNSTFFDTFANSKPPSWSTGAIDPSAVIKTENISTFGLDYFRAESL